MKSNTWKDDIILALENIGGEGHYSDIYETIKEIRNPENLNNTWTATVRGTIERFSSDSKVFNGKDDLFYSVHGLGKGIWGLRDFDEKVINIDLTEDDIEFPEGKKELRKHIARERNPNLVRKAKQLFIKTHQKLFCEVCDFDFHEKYGELGKDFIEAHHIIPVSELEDNATTKITDLVMVCSNCHKMLHRKRPWLTKDKLKQLL